MFIAVDDATYHVTKQGSGPPVVLLHGFTSTMHTWEHVITALKENFTVIAIDLPGHGKTVTPDRSMEKCCIDIAFILQTFHYPRVHMVGYSMGGRTALTFAQMYPKMVRSLTLESASPGLRTEQERLERKSMDEKLATRIKREGIEAFVDFWENIPLFASQKVLEQQVQARVRKERLSQKPSGLAMSLRHMGTGKQTSLWHTLQSCAVPIYLLVGAYDDKFVEINQEMVALFPDAQIDIIEGVGHAVHVEQPEVFVRHIKAFLHEQEVMCSSN